MRSVPDVVSPGNPGLGLKICEADAGGCPTGLQYGGTSLSTPMWAGFAAVLNEIAGHPLGWLNPLVYPLAATSSFHSAAGMKSDFAHVGLGSPNGDLLALALTGGKPGPVDASVSSVTAMSPNPELPFFGAVAADGSSSGDYCRGHMQLRRNQPAPVVGAGSRCHLAQPGPGLT
jgi:hypothetical protein